MRYIGAHKFHQTSTPLEKLMSSRTAEWGLRIKRRRVAEAVVPELRSFILFCSPGTNTKTFPVSGEATPRRPFYVFFLRHIVLAMNPFKKRVPYLRAASVGRLVSVSGADILCVRKARRVFVAASLFLFHFFPPIPSCPFPHCCHPSAVFYVCQLFF